jgi:hypothetical protein
MENEREQLFYEPNIFVPVPGVPLEETLLFFVGFSSKQE